MINFRGFILLIVVVLSAADPVILNAQKVSARSLAEMYQQRTLVVVIPSHRKKITALQKSIGEGDSSHRTQELLQRTQFEQSLWQKEIMSAVSGNFTFSEAVFMMDSVLRKDLQDLPVFSFDFSPAIVQRNEVWFLVKGNLESGAEALIFQNEQQQSLQRPFPYYRKLKSIGTLFESFFTSRKPHWKQLDQLIEKMNARLLKVVGSD